MTDCLCKNKKGLGLGLARLGQAGLQLASVFGSVVNICCNNVSVTTG